MFKVRNQDAFTVPLRSGLLLLWWELSPHVFFLLICWWFLWIYWKHSYSFTEGVFLFHFFTSLLVLSKFAWFLYFIQNILPEIFDSLLQLGFVIQDSYSIHFRHEFIFYKRDTQIASHQRAVELAVAYRILCNQKRILS